MTDYKIMCADAIIHQREKRVEDADISEDLMDAYKKL